MLCRAVNEVAFHFTVCVCAGRTRNTLLAPKLNDNIKAGLKETGCGFVWLRIGSSVVGPCENGDEPPGTKKGGSFMTSRVTVSLVSFSSKSLLHGATLADIFGG